MRKATTRIIAGALSAALVLTGVNMPNKSASAASAKLNKDRVVLYVGGNNTATIKAKNVDSVKFKSKDESVAKVNKTTGKVTAKGAGKTKVIATTDAGKLKCVVRVYKAIKTLTTDTAEVSLAPGETQTVSVGVKPAKAQKKMWKVTTSDKTVATKKKANGKKGTFDITAVAEGTATITVSSTDGGSAPDATVKVDVVEAAEDADAAGEDTDASEDVSDETPSQAEVIIDADAALTNADQTELYIYYRTVDEEGNDVENPLMGWSVSTTPTNHYFGEGTALSIQDRSDLGILIVYAPKEESFSKNTMISVYGKSMNSDATVEKDMVVGDVRKITSVEFGGIVQSVYSGWWMSGGQSIIGDTMPFDFWRTIQDYEDSYTEYGTLYDLAFNAYDQNGDLMINVLSNEYNLASKNMETDILDTKGAEVIAKLDDGDGRSSETVGGFIETNVDGTLYSTLTIEPAELAEVGGEGQFIITSSVDENNKFEFNYVVGTGSDVELVGLELEGQTGGKIYDGRNETININGVFADGTVYENIVTEKLEATLGKAAVKKMYASTGQDIGSYSPAENAQDGVNVATLDLGSGVITWTDGITDPYGAKEENGTYEPFDDTVRSIEVSLENTGLGNISITLSVYDPIRPVDTKEVGWNNWGFNVDECDTGVVFVDQYGEENWTLSYEELGSFLSRAQTTGYNIKGVQTYYGFGFVSADSGVALATDVACSGISDDWSGGWCGEISWSYALNGKTYKDAEIGILRFAGSTGIASDYDSAEEALLNAGSFAGASIMLGTVSVGDEFEYAISLSSATVSINTDGSITIVDGKISRVKNGAEDADYNNYADLSAKFVSACVIVPDGENKWYTVDYDNAENVWDVNDWSSAKSGMWQIVFTAGNSDYEETYYWYCEDVGNGEGVLSKDFPAWE